MHLRIIDYAANPGGGVRFAVETTNSLARLPGTTVDVVSSGQGLAAYERLFRGRVAVRLLDIPPANARAVRWRHYATAPVIPAIGRALGLGFCFHFDVPPSALEGADVVWLPWLHSHRLPPGRWNVVGSLHDVILLEFRDHFGHHVANDEEETLRSWLASDRRIVVSSEATARTLAERLGARRERLDVIPLSGRHRAQADVAEPRSDWRFVRDGFLLCPANISPHKNHEVMLDALALLAERRPLVLTGPGTDLRSPFGRARTLRARVRARGLTLGRDVIGLGYLDDREYYSLLRHARCLVMPTLAEGGGSFPVWEALFEGVPVICSDIPVMREMMERAGGDVAWFDPRSPSDLARCLSELERDYERHLHRAREQISRIRARTWDEVAGDYMSVLMYPRDGGVAHGR